MDERSWLAVISLLLVALAGIQGFQAYNSFSSSSPVGLTEFNRDLQGLSDEVDRIESNQNALLDKSTFNEEDFAQQGTQESVLDSISGIGSIVGSNGSSVDAFGKQIADSTMVEADLASHYPYSQERWRLYSGDDSTDSNRIFLQYNNDSRYCHGRRDGDTCEKDVHQLRPGEGENLIFQSAERFRYVVQYVSKSSQAFSVNRSIDGSSHVVLGSLKDDNGYAWNFTNDTHAEVFMMRNGEKVSSRVVELPRPVTDFNRYAIEFNWYNVGNAKFIQTYTVDGEQRNEVVAKLSVDGERGSNTGNLPITYEVYRGSGSEPLELNAGSSGFVTLGDVEPLTRMKSAYFSDSVSSTGSWEPIRAFRVDPDREIVNVQQFDLEVLSYGSDTTVQLGVMACSNAKVTFSGGDSWGIPEVWSDVNNAVETRTDVNGIPNSEGVVEASPDDPGCYLVGKSVLSPTNQQFQKGTSGSAIQVLRNLPARDVGVVVANVGQTGTVGYSTSIQQEW